MAIKLVIAVTDDNWFELLRRQPNLAEVNFWAPSAVNFRALQPGELFLFKLHAPRNFIVGGGVFTHATQLPCSLAWKAFGRANGVHSEQEMRQRIAKYRRVTFDDRNNPSIGCRILTQPFFLEKADWIPVPESWSPRIVTFKTYDTRDAEGLALWESINSRLRSTSVTEDLEHHGKPQLIRPRLGEGAFRMLVTDAYKRRCAITQERTLPALQTAHIRPYGDDGTHEARNGLLLRSDIRQLFGAGYVTVTPELRFEVSLRIREEFENGRDYYSLHGQSITVPDKPSLRPDPNALAWHNERCFRGW